MSNNEFEGPLSTDVLHQQIMKELDTIQKEHAEVGVITKDGDIGVIGSVSRDIGKPGGWEVAAEGGWMKKTKAWAAAILTWKGKSE